MDNLENDTLVWATAADGEFHLKLIYDKIGAEYIPEVDQNLCQHIWQWKGTPKIQCFLWKCLHGKLPTNEERVTRDMTHDPVCSKCNEHPESIMHALWDCPAVTDLWNYVIHEDHWASFFSLGFWCASRHFWEGEATVPGGDSVTNTERRDEEKIWRLDIGSDDESVSVLRAVVMCIGSAV
ncbi:Reverse transcriptase zinc-binding domain [Sesbania bispinosa]|nr:Reverse transcriptase zinc-binding domain [Sesbania bispinosa]